MSISVAGSSTALSPDSGMQRQISWTGAFWIVSGVPARVLTSIGAIAATVGTSSWLVWIVSIMFRFIQAFSYAEIAGISLNKSGGQSVYDAIAWMRYGKFFAPISVWCNWLAWSQVQSLASCIAAAYVLTALFSAESSVNTWQLTIADPGAVKQGLLLRINATFVVGAAIFLIAFLIQHSGIRNTARIQIVHAVASVAPLLLIGIVPLISGQVQAANLLPLFSLAKYAGGTIVAGSWDMAGVTLLAGGLFIAAWSTYAFETAVCYTRKFRDAARDAIKAIIYSGLLCMFIFTVVPITFQCFFGLGQITDPAVLDAAGVITKPAEYSGILNTTIASGMGVAKAMARMVGAGLAFQNLIVVMMILALVLAIITSMAGSSRTLYQASVDGWLPRYLGKTNAAGAPTTVMWTGLGFNLILLMMSDYVFILAILNVCCIIFNFLNLNAAWLHRIDRPDTPRLYRAPTALLAAGTALSLLNLALMGMGADTWGKSTLVAGIFAVLLIVPVFAYRHYIVDKGVFPDAMAKDMALESGGSALRRAGLLPYLTLAVGVLVVVVARYVAVYQA